MAEILFRVGRWSYLHKWTVIVAWIVLLGSVGGAAAAFSRPLTSEFAISGVPSIDAAERVAEVFPEGGNPVNAATVNVIFAAPEGHTLAEDKYREAMGQVIDFLAENIAMTDSQRFGDPFEITAGIRTGLVEEFVSMGLPEELAREDADNLAMVNAAETIAYTTFEFDAISAYSVDPEDKRQVYEALDLGRSLGLSVEAGGPGFGEDIAINTTSEIIGLAVAFVVLLVTFGSVVASIIPLVSAVVGVGLGVGAMLISTHWVELNEMTPVLAVMIGLAVGIDYALFIVSRYRAERGRMRGVAPEDIVGLSVGTAGSSVVFAGVTVFTALVALVVARIELLSAMGLAAATTVAVAVLVAITLLPAILGLLGPKAFSGRIPWVARSSRTTMGRRVATTIRKAPAVVFTLVVLSLAALSIPALNLSLALPSDDTANTSTTQRKAADLMAEGFGPGFNGLFLAVVEGGGARADAMALSPLVAGQDSEQPAALASYLYAVERLKTTGGVAHAQLVSVREDGQAAQIMITPDSGPADEQTVRTVAALRVTVQEIEDATGADIAVTGLIPTQVDITERLGEAMVPYLGIVVGLAIVLLILVFRSIMVPVVAAAGFLLSVGASFGLTVLVWQEGLFGLVETPGPLISFLPIFLIGVTFGLAMDYQVFLVTRMREAYLKSGDVHSSTVEGYATGARVVTAAAIIMISVFVAFINQPLPFIQIFGFALAASVFFDAFFIRMAFVPATMSLLGSAAWWMPRWLDRVLPEIDIEGVKLEEKWHDRVEQEAAN